jgi:hypothetical protein
MNKTSIALLLAAATLLAADSARAACVNRFVSRTERQLQIVTLLTGKLTFQEAQALAADIKARKATPFEWVDEGGKLIAKQFGELKVVRPMPVGCDGKSSGVVVIASFATANTPSRKMMVRMAPDTTVTFEQQSE